MPIRYERLINSINIQRILRNRMTAPILQKQSSAQQEPKLPDQDADARTAVLIDKAKG